MNISLIKTKTSKIKIGLTLIIGLLIVTYFIFIVGTESSLFSPSYHLKILIENVEGLSSGSMVTLGGLKIGTIKELNFEKNNNENGIEVILKIKTRYKDKITQSSIAEVKTMGMLGDKYIDLKMGKTNEAPLAEGSYLILKPPNDLSTLMNTIMNQLPPITNTIQSIGLLADDIRNGKGTLGKLIYDNDLYQNVNNITNSLNKFAYSLNNNDGLLNAAINDKNLSSNLESTVSNLKKFSDLISNDKNSFNKLLTNDSLIIKINTILTQTDLFINKLNSSNSSIGKVMNENNLYNQINELVINLNNLIKDINQNPKKYINVSVF